MIFPRLISAFRSSAANPTRNAAAFGLFRNQNHVAAVDNEQASRIKSSSRLFASNPNDLTAQNSVDTMLQASGYARPPVQWYPGHIAKAERQLAETLRAVDVVVEVRDARAPKATSHPQVGAWCAGRPRIVVITHMDAVPVSSVKAWKEAYMSDTYGAVRNDAVADPQVRNQASQARAERARYNKSSQGAKSDSTTTPVEQVLFVDARQGQGIHALHRAIFKAGAHVQERRDRRGLRERALRVGIIGYPNVGKSALINKILGRRRARTANTPGVTRSLQWIRINSDESKIKATTANTASKRKREFELLDSPGIIPARMVDQSDAVLLAACNCIGEAAYDNQAVAAYLCEWLKTLHLVEEERITAPVWKEKFIERYGFDPLEKVPMNYNPNMPYGYTGLTSHAKGDSDDDDEERMRYRSGEDILFHVADNTCKGDPEDASRKILQDFRTGRMGPICLQPPPRRQQSEDVKVPIQAMDGSFIDASRIANIQADQENMRRLKAAQAKERAQAAVETAKARGLELPPIVAEPEVAQDEDVGKGMFDGW